MDQVHEKFCVNLTVYSPVLRSDSAFTAMESCLSESLISVMYFSCYIPSTDITSCLSVSVNLYCVDWKCKNMLEY